MIAIYPYGNVSAVDAYFFGASASTESGLNTVDVKALKTYQQLVIYIIPVITNLGFVHPAVIAVRLYWFKKKLRSFGASGRPAPPETDVTSTDVEAHAQLESIQPSQLGPISSNNAKQEGDNGQGPSQNIVSQEERKPRIAFSPDTNPPRETPRGLHVPPPPERASAAAAAAVDDDDDADTIKPVPPEGESGRLTHRRSHAFTSHDSGPSTSMFAARSFEKAASALFVMTPDQPRERRRSNDASSARLSNPGAFKDLPSLSKTATIGRNSQFRNLTKADREKLGGLEYRALKLLLPITLGKFPFRRLGLSVNELRVQATSSVSTSSASSASSLGFITPRQSTLNGSASTVKMELGGHSTRPKPWSTTSASPLLLTP
jgi:hypothetical protein